MYTVSQGLIACTLRLYCKEEVKDMYTVSQCFGLNTVLE